MTCKYKDICLLLFGALLIVLTFVNWAPSRWIIFAIGILLILRSISANCSSGACSFKGHKTGEELFMTKSKQSDMPTKKELEEVITKAAKKPVKKVVKKKAARKKVAKK